MSSNQQSHQQKPKQQVKTSETTSGITFLRRPTVLKRLGVGATTLFEGIERGIYPRPVKFSVEPNAKRVISLWAEHEITAAQQQLIAARDEAIVRARP
jgi:predicted DNA-binding transcriptional regulator AlpA